MRPRRPPLAPLAVLSFVLLRAGPARAETWPAAIVLGVAGAAGALSPSEGQAGSLGGFGCSRLLLRPELPGGAPLAIDLGARTGLLAKDLRESTQIAVGLRWEPGLPYLRAGLVHAHETPWAVVEEQPIAAMAGVAPGIRHRSGAELALGLHPALVPRVNEGQSGAFVELAGLGLPDAGGPRLYAQLEVGFSIGLGRPR